MIESDIYNNNVAVSNNSSEMNNNNQSRNHYADPKTVNNPTQVVRASKKRKLNNSESSSEETAREHFLQKIYQLCLTEGSGIDFHPCVEFCGVCINDKTKFEQSYGPTHGSVDNNFKTWQFYKLLRNGKTFWYYKPNPYLFNSELNGDVSQFISATQARGKETENYERYQKLFHDKHAAKILWDNNLVLLIMIYA